MSELIFLLLTAVAAFVQNMAFTWVSRSRNSGDPAYHRYAALCSNSVWFVTQLLILNQVMAVARGAAIWHLAVLMGVYVLATTEGSVLMMRILLKSEKGKRKVGSS